MKFSTEVTLIQDFFVVDFMRHSEIVLNSSLNNLNGRKHIISSVW